MNKGVWKSNHPDMCFHSGVTLPIEQPTNESMKAPRMAINYGLHSEIRGLYLAV